MTPTSRKILVIDDNQEILQAYDSILNYDLKSPGAATEKMAALLAEDVQDSDRSNRPDFALSFATQGQDGYDLVKKSIAAGCQFSVAFIDIRMPPGWDGMETATKIRQIDSEIEIVIVTAYTDRSREEIVSAVGSPSKLLFLRKPFDPEELYQMALSLSEKWLLQRREMQAKAALSKSEEKFRTLVETTPDFVWAMDTAGCYTYCSPICSTLYKMSPKELLGKPFYNTLMRGDQASYHQSLYERCVQEKTAFKNSERFCRRQDGVEIHIESSGHPILDEHGAVKGFRGIDRDVTERWELIKNTRQLEEQFQQAQKMEAIGTLASGIAHDINNVLTPIFGYAEICCQENDPESETYKYLEIIKLSADKAADLIRQILLFCKKHPRDPVPSSIVYVIEQFMKILRRLIREDIELAVELDDNVWSVNIDKSQMEQVLINLVVNARDAISGGNGRIVISAANASIPVEQAKIDATQQSFSGDYVLLSVSDNGDGMDPAILSKIFDPFFTTKEEGKGTGLGLATVFGVTKQYNGHIQMDTQVGQGTTFKIYLPCSEETAEDEEIKEDTSLPRGHETILVVEDDQVICKMTVSLIQRLGYKVLSASNGREAFEAFRQADGAIDLLTTDVVMPDLGGVDLVKALRKAKDSLPVIFISGYPQDFAPEGLLETANTDFTKKPFTTKILAEKIRNLLDGNK